MVLELQQDKELLETSRKTLETLKNYQTPVGQKEMVKEELEKLAQANKIGKESDWEFNEWLHGKTGKPMGARFQSWSVAGYIIAYESVKEGKLVI
ncbi:MAG: hypothetical protein QMD14_04635 [Candidatus Aenigmarchaeota archaeon]|nr:hypothetical protein [Candidatus Aenigmarchaeota archaeon]